jgi:regulator of protease activity HflC (stomatin/prohibitin superfamily)
MSTQDSPRQPSTEIALRPVPGGLLLLLTIVAYLTILAAVIVPAIREGEAMTPVIVLLVLATIALPFLLRGFFVVNPREGRVLVRFGRYMGTVREPGFFWVNPFATRTSISLKAVNIASERIKVNDLDGNPIEIGAVVVYRVRDTAQASFDVEDYRRYADVQVETAVRRLASTHPYDDAENPQAMVSLRGDSEVVAQELMEELQARLDRAGIEVIEARISHLAYAPEIAAAMLQRQQAAAIISARRRIVEGAVGMVDDALSMLAEKGVVDLDPERKATLVGNLLVVLCGQADAQPVINTGTLYN